MVSLKCKEIMCLLYSSLLFLSGIFLIGFSIVLLYKLFFHMKFVPIDTYWPFVVFLFLGIFHSTLTWLGIKGPTKEHDFHIILFTTLIGILCIVEFGTGIWSTVLWNDVEDKAVGIMNESFSTYFNYEDEWKMMESKCCGVNGFDDYSNFRLNISCKMSEGRGCKESLVEYVEYLLLQIGLTGFISSLFLIVGIAIFSIFYKHLQAERINRSNLRRSRLQSALSGQLSQTLPNGIVSSAPPV